jgi:hypothetical protein
MNLRILPLCCLLAGAAWSSEIAKDDFESGKLGKPLWIGDTYVSVVEGQAVSGTKAARFHFSGSPAGDALAELRFDLGKPYRDLWFAYSFYIPKNYTHRQSGNHKFFRLWGTDYGDKEKIGASTWGNSPADGFSRLRCDWDSTGGGMGEGGKNYPNFITAADLGTWMRVMIHCEAATAEVKGTIQIWKNGTLIIDNPNQVALYKEGSIHAYKQGYLLGWANKGFAEDTDFYIDDVVFGTTRADVETTSPADPKDK